MTVAGAYVLMVSANGRGVFDAARLARVGRDRAPIAAEDVVGGISPIAGAAVPQMRTYGSIGDSRSSGPPGSRRAGSHS